MTSANNEFLFKILVIGDSGAGKTSFIRRYVHSVFVNHYKATIGVDFAFKNIQYDEKTSLKIQLWDVAGQERFSEMTRVYYKDAIAVLVFFDLTAGEKSLSTTVNWKRDVDRKVFLPDGSPVPCLLIGNKLDLMSSVGDASAQQLMSDQFLIDYCAQHGYEKFFRVSAKDNSNVDEAMSFVLDRAVSCMRRIVEEDAKQGVASMMMANNNNNGGGGGRNDSSIRLVSATPSSSSSAASSNSNANNNGCC